MATFYTSAILTTDDLERSTEHSKHVRARESRVRYYQEAGRLLPIRRGLYAVVPENSEPSTFRVDPFLIAASLAPDAVLAYHTALEFHGKTYSSFHEFHTLSRHTVRPFRFQSQRFRILKFPQTLLRQHEETFGIQETQREGVTVRVTSFERTLVDVLHRPDIAGGWEEVWRSLESIEFVDVEQVIRYASLLQNGRTCAAVGFYLEQHRETLMIEDAMLEPLRKRRPKVPQYFDRSARKGGKLVSGWNLLVPPVVLERSWEEPT